MNFSNTYLLYPDNRALERAIANSMLMLGENFTEVAAPNTKVTVADNFRQTRGNYEQHRFSSNILESAREALQVSLTKEYCEQAPFAWAQSQNSLGNIVATLGQQYRDVELFKMAIECFNNGLELLNQETFPLDWAATQYNLGTAQQALGRQQADSEILKASIHAYTNALLVWSKEKTPFEWASAMHQLGDTMHTHGMLLKGNRTLQKSVVAYKNALAVWDADNYALELAATHNNRGTVLHHLGESEKNPDRMAEAIKSYDTALTVCMEQQLPIHLAVLCRVNKSTAQSVLADLTKDKTLADEVVDQFDLIIECFPQSLQPLCLKHCEAQLNKAKSRTLEISASG